MAQRNFCVVETKEQDVPEMMDLQFAACEGDPFHLSIWGPNTTDQKLNAEQRLLAKWRNDPWLHVVKCVEDQASCTVQSNPSNSRIMAFCLWDIFKRTGPVEEWKKEDEMETCNWLAGHERDVARAYLVPAIEGRQMHMEGRPYALLTNMCTHPKYQRKGAAVKLVEWGIRKADELGIPAYLEASESGYGVYAKVGFHKIGAVKTVIDGQLVEEYPVMLRQPNHQVERQLQICWGISSPSFEIVPYHGCQSSILKADMGNADDQALLQKQFTITPKTASLLIRMGYTKYDHLRTVSPNQLVSHLKTLSGMTPKLAEGYRRPLRRLVWVSTTSQPEQEPKTCSDWTQKGLTARGWWQTGYDDMTGDEVAALIAQRAK